MKALFFAKTGSLDLLQVADIPVPPTAPGHVRVIVKAAAINPSDIKNVLGKMHETTLPRIPGRDFSGIVDNEIGPFHRGDEVFGSGGALGFNVDGSHAEKVSVPFEAVRSKPKNIDFLQAASIGVPYLTAWKAIFTKGHLEQNESILITGATGAVGGAGVRLAKTVPGVRVLATIRNQSEIAGNPLGNLVDAWIDLSGEPLEQQVRAHTENQGVDLAFDVVGGPLFEPVLRSLKRGGRQVAIASNPAPAVSFNLVDFYHNESRLIGVDSLKTTFAESGEILEKILPSIESGLFPAPQRLQAVGFSELIAAYQTMNTPGNKAKFVFVPDHIPENTRT